MLSKFTVIFALMLAITVQGFSHVLGRESIVYDSIDIQKDNALRKERSNRFYDSLESKTTKHAVPRMLYNALFVKSHRDSLNNGGVVDESRELAKFDGRTIGEIKIVRNDIFDKKGNFLERFANSTHHLTRERTILRDMLFTTGDKFDSKRVVNNEQLLRSRDYIYDVTIDVNPSPQDSMVVDIIVRTRDSWTWGADAALNVKGRTMLEFYDANLLGYGNKLSVKTNFNWANGDYGGNLVEYDIPNILGSFYQANFIVGRNFENSDMGFSVQKKFILPTDYEVGFLYSDRQQLYYMIAADSGRRVDMRLMNAWGGYSKYIKSINSSVYSMVSYDFRKFDVRPDVGPYLNPSLHNSKDLLCSFGLYREKFLSTSLIYGFGFKEYLSSGYRAELITGYSWGEFAHDWYLGMSYRMGGFTSLGYLMGGFTLGSYINPLTGKWHQSGLDCVVYAFSRLYTAGQSRIRQFMTLNYTHGWNRYDGSDEMIRFTNARGPRGFKEHIVGLNRAVLNTETVVFTPLQPLGFRIAFFGFADFGLLGGYSNLFRNDFFSTFGLGVRLKNERLVFNTIQIKLGFAVGKNGFMPNNNFNVSSEQRLSQFRYLPTRPETVNFK